MPNITATPMPGGITVRALHTADRRRRDSTHPPTWRDERWTERAEACARELAALLGITPDLVQISPDYTRASLLSVPVKHKSHVVAA
ncbi:hypothetical protein [Actinospica robiniae]|uniref:hypothetical protein n=1 Tax=Actinospica robiniae TaxID=304901 RepID=UPI0003F5D3E0|nr:hypothetical protein [Actinospica robiniae]